MFRYNLPRGIFPIRFWYTVFALSERLFFVFCSFVQCSIVQFNVQYWNCAPLKRGSLVPFPKKLEISNSQAQKTYGPTIDGPKNKLGCVVWASNVFNATIKTEPIFSFFFSSRWNLQPREEVSWSNRLFDKPLSHSSLSEVVIWMWNRGGLNRSR